MKLTYRKWLLPIIVMVVLLAAIPTLAASLPGDGPRTPGQKPAGEGNSDAGQGNGASDGDISVVDGQRMKKVPAPIDAVQINMAKSLPPQYFVYVQYGLPSGCAKPAGYEFERSGNEVRIKVFIFLPAENVACTMIYGSGTHNVPMGADFVSGQTYRVDVNGTVKTLVAQ